MNANWVRNNFIYNSISLLFSVIFTVSFSFYFLFPSSGFAELQTDLGELVGDLTGTRLPYHDLHTYLLQSLFPGSKDHPTLHPPQVIQTFIICLHVTPIMALL